MGCDLRVVQEPVERAIQERGYKAMTSFIRMGKIQIETGILREGLPGFDDGRAILPADGPRDLVVFTVEAEWSAAVHEFSDGESQGRHRLGFLRSPSMVQDEGQVLPAQL